MFFALLAPVSVFSLGAVNEIIFFWQWTRLELSETQVRHSLWNWYQSLQSLTHCPEMSANVRIQRAHNSSSDISVDSKVQLILTISMSSFQIVHSFIILAGTSFVSLIAANNGILPVEGRQFTLSQINYILGSSGHSFVIGFGENPPIRSHHRAEWVRVTHSTPTCCGYFMQ